MKLKSRTKRIWVKVKCPYCSRIEIKKNLELKTMDCRKGSYWWLNVLCSYCQKEYDIGIEIWVSIDRWVVKRNQNELD